MCEREIEREIEIVKERYRISSAFAVKEEDISLLPQLLEKHLMIQLRCQDKKRKNCLDQCYDEFYYELLVHHFQKEGLGNETADAQEPSIFKNCGYKNLCIA